MHASLAPFHPGVAHAVGVLGPGQAAVHQPYFGLENLGLQINGRERRGRVSEIFVRVLLGAWRLVGRVWFVAHNLC